MVQHDLVERSQEAEARSRHNENLLTEALAQIASGRESYRLTLSIKPETDFLLLRVVMCEGSQIRLRDRILSPGGADELFEQLQRANHDLSQYVFWIGMARQVMTRGNVTYSRVREAWNRRQVLWVILSASYSKFRRSWAHHSDQNAMDELEREGFTLSVSDGRLLYSDPDAQHRPTNGRKRKRGTPWRRVSSRSRSPRGFDRDRSSNRSRSPVRGKTGSARRSTSADTQNTTNPVGSAVQLVGGSQTLVPTADVVISQESMQTVKRIEDVMEDE